MEITDRLFEALGLVTNHKVTEATHASYVAGWNEGNDEPPSGTLASFRYTSRATTGGRRDMTIAWEEQTRAVWDVYNSNPMAERGMELKRDNILGRGVEVETESEPLEEVFEAFKGFNQFNTRIREYTLQLFLFGIQVFPVAVPVLLRQARLSVLTESFEPQRGAPQGAPPPGRHPGGREPAWP